MALSHFTLVLGGAASGKSAFAESLVTNGPNTPVYIATSQVFDAEMEDKVAAHRTMRGTNWHTIEEPLDIAAALALAPLGSPVLIDCATLWLTNIILRDDEVDAATHALVDAIARHPDPVVIVSNEVGYGIVPENALSRRFRNAQGRLNQQIAQQADCVVSVMAGLPLVLKGVMP